MAVEMVRKPSETPNIENVDDFMPIRYAYANQNGYVIGRGRIGTGIDADAYTINGNTFTINSGRLVLQGVECDINTEHSIVIDISATKRYYAIYLQVNLATNTSDILVTYDTLGTPIVDTGEDLTINSVGTARMVLFTFEATNGLISNVVKVMTSCKYYRPVLLYQNIDGLNYGEIGNFTENLEVGDVVEVYYGIERWTTNPICFKFIYNKDGVVNTIYNSIGEQLGVTYMRNWDCGFNIMSNSIQIGYGKSLWFSIPNSQGSSITLNNNTEHNEHKVYAVYKLVGYGG